MSDKLEDAVITLLSMLMPMQASLPPDVQGAIARIEEILDEIDDEDDEEFKDDP